MKTQILSAQIVIHNVRIDGCRANIRVAKHITKIPNITVVLEEISCE